MQLFLIRHPRPFLTAGICYGRLDVEAEDPQAIAIRLRSRLPADTPVFASPLQRARRLAEALHPRPIFDARLQELDFGEWEGVAWDEIDRQLLDAWASDVLHFVAPGGESVAMLQKRALDFVDGLRGSSFALVTHAGIIRALLGHWLRLPVGVWSRLPVDFGSVTLIETKVSRHGLKQEQQERPAGVLHYRNR